MHTTVARHEWDTNPDSHGCDPSAPVITYLLRHNLLAELLPFVILQSRIVYLVTLLIYFTDRESSPSVTEAAGYGGAWHSPFTAALCLAATLRCG